jgi:hypothetical protein
MTNGTGTKIGYGILGAFFIFAGVYTILTGKGGGAPGAASDFFVQGPAAILAGLAMVAMGSAVLYFIVLGKGKRPQ